MPGSKRISGTTWEVYLYILTSEGPQGVREIWRGLKLSTPSLAQYHVNKLLDLGLIEATSEGKYRLNEMERIDVLKSFIILRGKLVPRLVFYGALLLGIFLAYLILWPFMWDYRDLIVLVVSLFSISAFFFEAYNQYKGLAEAEPIISEPKENESYDKLLMVFISAYGSRGKSKLERAIEKYTKKGLTREEAIQKVAQEEGYA